VCNGELESVNISDSAVLIGIKGQLVTVVLTNKDIRSRTRYFRHAYRQTCDDTNSVRTSQETHYVSATKPNRLMLFRETVAVYCEIHVEHTNTLCRQNAEL
jgi:hypothetical protein